MELLVSGGVELLVGVRVVGATVELLVSAGVELLVVARVELDVVCMLVEVDGQYCDAGAFFCRQKHTIAGTHE